MLYQLPRNFTAQTLERGAGKPAMHLKPGRVIELGSSDLELLSKEMPKVAKALRENAAKPLSPAKRKARESKLATHSHAHSHSPASPKSEKLDSGKRDSKKDKQDDDSK